jgi:RHS repeat-associated protein
MLLAITGPDGKTIQYSYNAGYQLVHKIDRDGRRSSYAYQSHEPTAVLDSSSGTRARLSNSNNWATDANQLALNQLRVYLPSATTVTDGRNNLVHYHYNSSGYLETTTYPDGATTTYTYDSSSLMVRSVTNANGHTTTYAYDSMGNRTQTTDSLGNITTYTYEPVFNQLTSTTDPRGRMTTYTYDVNGNMTSSTDPLGQTDSYTFDGRGNVISHVDKNGRTTSYTYSSTGNLVETTDALGDTIRMTYDVVGNRTSIVDANGNITSYQYDSLNRLTREIDAAGHNTDYQYDAEGNRTQTIDRNGNTTRYQYDLRQRLTATIDAAGRTESYSYDGNDNRTSMTDRNGKVTTSQYDLQNRLTRVTDPLGGVTVTAYDPVGNVVSQTDANSHTTTYTYDQRERRTTQTDPVGGVTRFTYDTGTLTGCPTCGATPGSRLVTKKTDAAGHVTYYKYDALDRLIKEVRKVGGTADTITASDAVTTTTYDPVGNTLTTTEPNGNTTTYQYDAVNRPTRLTNAAGDVTQMAYDPVGNVVTRVLPNGNVVSYLYDALNRLVQERDSVGPIRTLTYDFVGNRTSETNGNGSKTAYGYDTLNRVVTVIDPLNNATTYQYDFVGNLVKVVDRTGAITTYGYDGVNRRVTMTDALTNVTTYEYDPTGNRTKLTDAKGHATRYQYDNADRLTRQASADGTFRSFTYDPVGNRKSRTDAIGRMTTYTYDDLDRLITRAYPSLVNDSFAYDLSGRLITAQRGAWPVTFTYDAANRVTQSVQNGYTVSYSYNVPGRTQTVGYPSGRVITDATDLRNRLSAADDGGPPIVRYTYDNGNRVLTRAYRNGETAAYTYNANDWLTTLEHAGTTFVALLNYAYDNEGDKRFEEKLQDPTRSEAYQYDATHRLIDYKVGTLVGSTVPVPSTQTAYSLDPVGNWTTKTTNGVPQARIHNVVNELTQIGATNLTYDANGNAVNDGAYSYTYDEEDRLVQVIRNADSSIVGEYRYDALGRRVVKVASAGSPFATTVYLYDIDRVIEERDSGGVTKATYVYGNAVDEVLTMDRGGQTYYYHENALGSEAAITDSTGASVERYAYDAYGSPSVTTGAGVPVAPNAWGTSHSAIGNPYLFTGREFDEESGLYFYRARYYDAIKGRFLQRDTVEQRADTNLYEYVDSNPTHWVDPYGHQSVQPVQPYNPSPPVPSGPIAPSVSDALARQIFGDPSCCQPYDKRTSRPVTAGTVEDWKGEWARITEPCTPQLYARLQEQLRRTVPLRCGQNYFCRGQCSQPTICSFKPEETTDQETREEESRRYPNWKVCWFKLTVRCACDCNDPTQPTASSDARPQPLGPGTRPSTPPLPPEQGPALGAAGFSLASQNVGK